LPDSGRAAAKAGGRFVRPEKRKGGVRLRKSGRKKEREKKVGGPPGVYRRTTLE